MNVSQQTSDIFDGTPNSGGGSVAGPSSRDDYNNNCNFCLDSIALTLDVNFEIWLRYDSRSETHNNRRQFRDAVLGDMASRHRVQGHSVQIIKVESVEASENRRQAVSRLQVTVPAGAAIPPQALPESATSKLCRRRQPGRSGAEELTAGEVVDRVPGPDHVQEEDYPE
ncbi:60S ribosomal protein L18a [Culex quinquefasciatus]|uniref:60S ribosomal protein L18a n=1 Tax=Culex quinquefasciatus TaxID=7176 RepID=B0X8J7_CULQU|nr:60S ribosomal protein L18a [Culex quinquefasciatus]|eukprot:XP_001865957.1 60S ribosomal protein L18a [Culex quinquefasciatus]